MTVDGTAAAVEGALMEVRPEEVLRLGMTTTGPAAAAVQDIDTSRTQRQLSPMAEVAAAGAAVIARGINDG